MSVVLALEETLCQPEVLYEGARACVRHLLVQQRRDGRYNYRYDARRDAVDNSNYNLVRHAGCAWSMAWASAALEPDLAVPAAASAERALRHLLSLARPLPGPSHGLFIPLGQEGRLQTRGKLGAVALTLLAMQLGPLQSTFAGERRRLLATVLALQGEDGSFQCWVHRPNDGDTNHDYYPGEALLACCHEARRSVDPAPLHALIRAFPFYREHFRQRPATAFLLWQTDAWRLFYETLTGLPGHRRPSGLAAPREYADFVFEQADWLLPLQHTPERAPVAWAGGFSTEGPPGAASATYTEAMVRACGLAHRVGDTARFERYRRSARLGLAFLQRLQLGAEQASRCPRPELALGGVAGQPGSFQLRNDRAQHVLTACLAALETPELFEQ